MAVGADRAKVVRLVLHGAFNRVLIGLLLGLPLAVGAGRLISSELYGVSSWDPLALIVAASGLAISFLCRHDSREPRSIHFAYERVENGVTQVSDCQSFTRPLCPDRGGWEDHIFPRHIMAIGLAVGLVEVLVGAVAGAWLYREAAA